MARVNPHGDNHEKGNDNIADTTSWLRLVTELQRNPLALLVLFAAYLATLTALVLIAGLTGVGLATLLATAALPMAKKARHRAHGRTTELDLAQTTPNETINSSEPPTDKGQNDP